MYKNPSEMPSCIASKHVLEFLLRVLDPRVPGMRWPSRTLLRNQDRLVVLGSMASAATALSPGLGFRARPPETLESVVFAFCWRQTSQQMVVHAKDRRPFWVEV